MRQHGKQWFGVMVLNMACLGLVASAGWAADPVKRSENARKNGKTAVQAVHHFRASTLMGMEVRNSQGEDLGKIEDLVLDMDSGKIRYAALSFGGFLGVGDKLFAVPMKVLVLRHDEEDTYFALDVAKERLETAPGFNTDAWPEFGDPKWGSEVDAFYGVADADADNQRRSGMVVSVTGDMLVMTDDDGNEHAHAMGPDVQVTVDGKPAKVRQVKKGDRITVTTMSHQGKDVVAAIDALTVKR